MSLKTKNLEIDVIAAARERVKILYDRFDTVAVSFSGGKDSSCVLQLCLEEARQRSRLPLEVFHFDEEAIYPDTIDYVGRIAASPEINMKWLCVPIKHRNACSREQPWWYPWNPAEKDKWVRELPEGAITHYPGFRFGMTAADAAMELYGPEYGRITQARGLRANESLNRRRAVTRREKDNWINDPIKGHVYPSSPIYDWTAIDVWVAIADNGWDYSPSYDVMDKLGISAHDQRVCPPFGEEPLGRLWTYAVGWPALWDKMIERVPGAATAGRYARTELYGFGKMAKPEGLSWREWLWTSIELYPTHWRAKIAHSVHQAIALHNKRTGNAPLHETDYHPQSGVSWKFLCNMVVRGDLKGRRKGKALANIKPIPGYSDKTHSASRS